LEETSALVHSLLGFLHVFDLMFNWSDSPAESFVEAEEYAQKALALNDSLDIPHQLMAWVHLVKKDYNKAILEANRGVALNPNGADTLVTLGFITCMAGEPEKAVIHLEKAFRLNPIPLSYYYHLLGLAYLSTDQYEKAVEILNKGISIDPELLPANIHLTSCYFELNEIDKAQSSAKRVLEIDPNFSLSYYKDMLPIKDQTVSERYIENLRQAGLPD